MEPTHAKFIIWEANTGFPSWTESTRDSDPTLALTTITGLAVRMDLHVNKLTDAVNSLSSATSNNLDKDG